jgi:hypothetical protein
MWETAVKKHDSKIKAEAEQQILADQLQVKFGLPAQARKKITAVTDSRKLRRALKAIVTASSREEVLKHLE